RRTSDCRPTFNVLCHLEKPRSTNTLLELDGMASGMAAALGMQRVLLPALGSDPSQDRACMLVGNAPICKLARVGVDGPERLISQPSLNPEHPRTPARRMK